MRLNSLYECVEGWRRECSIDGFEINASDGGHARFIVSRVEDKTREPGQFLPLIGNVTDRGPKHAMPGGKLKQHGPPRRQLRIVRRLRQRLASEFDFQLLEHLASCIDTRW